MHKLILAEDDAAMRSWMRTVLARSDVLIEEAGSGWEVLSLLADGGFDLVISDVRMPAPNGLQALAMARCAGVEVPFLLITAFGDDRLRSTATGLKASVLDKPFSAAELVDAMMRLGLERRSTRC